MDSAQKELASAIENSDAAAQIEVQKKIAALSIDEARLNALKEQQTTKKEEPAPKLKDADNLPESTPQSLPTPDPRAEAWATENSWFGKDRAMTFTAFEIHKDLVEREGFDPQTTEYYDDFILTLEFKQESNGNSGVFFRSTLEGVIINGWQVEIAPPGLFTGGIYESYGRGWLIQPNEGKDSSLKMGSWNNLKVKVYQDTVTTWLNGEMMITLSDQKIGDANGRIALQIHDGGGIKVKWKKLLP